MNTQTPIIEELKISAEALRHFISNRGIRKASAIELLDQDILPAIEELSDKRSVLIPKAGPSDTDGLNNEHTKAGRDVVDRYIKRTGVDKEDALCDLLCDLLHYADQYGYDFAHELRRACDHFEAETFEVYS